MIPVVIYIGRDNGTQWQLQEDCTNVDGTTVTRVTLNIPDHGDGVCLDSDSSPALISISDAGVVSAEIGTQVDTEGFYDAYLTVYTASDTNGIAWATFKLQVKSWQVCA